VHCHNLRETILLRAMKVLSTSDADIDIAARALREGKLVAIPTETVYGLGANAFDERAVAAVFEAKARPTFDPLIVHIARHEDIAQLALEVPEKARILAQNLWPGPLTMILPKRREVPDIVTAGLLTVAVRFPSHPVARRIIERAEVPIAAPSANPFGYLSPTTAEHVVAMLGERIDYVVDGGPCEVGVESTVIDMTSEPPTLLRPGGMPLERIEALIGQVVVLQQKDHIEPAIQPPKSTDSAYREAHGQSESQGYQGLTGLKSPGQSLSHYAPSTPLFLFDEGSLPAAAQQLKIVHPCVALVFNAARAESLKEIKGAGFFDVVQVLSEKGDMREAAARLFSLLHDLDSKGLAAIYAERVPDIGLGRAINDRLYRASQK